MNVAALEAPRQLALGAFCESLQTVHTTDDALLQAALRRLFIRDDFTQLTRTLQEILIALMARRDFKDPTEIHPSAWDQAFIAQAAGVSRSSVKRAYQQFEALGWLVRDVQDYDARKKRFGATRLAFTQAFIELTGLHRSYECAAKEVALRAPASTFVAPVDQNEPHINEDSPKQLLKKRHPPANAPGKAKPVPAELRVLIDRGINNWTVFWLMRLAGEAGKRLSDLVEVLQVAVEKRSGRQLVGFLRLKISDGIDYSWRLRQLRATASEQAQAAVAEASLDHLVDTQVTIDGLEGAITIKRMASGYYGECQRGGVPHGALMAAMRADRIHPLRHPGSPAVSPPKTTEPQRHSDARICQESIQIMRNLLGLRSR